MHVNAAIVSYTFIWAAAAAAATDASVMGIVQISTWTKRYIFHRDLPNRLYSAYTEYVRAAAIQQWLAAPHKRSEFPFHQKRRQIDITARAYEFSIWI